MTIPVNGGAVRGGAGMSNTRTVNNSTIRSFNSNISIDTNSAAASFRANGAQISKMAYGTLLQSAGENPLPQRPATSINLEIDTDDVKPVSRRGFSDQRPELIATFGFEPVFDSIDSHVSNAVGEMLDIQISARNLRAENVIRLINELNANSKVKPLVDQVKRQLEGHEATAEADVSLLLNMALKLGQMRKSFNIKLNSEAIKDEVRSARARNSRATSQRLAARSPVDILVQDMKFSQSSIQHFTNTKIIAQLLDDLRVIASSFSTRILDQHNSARASDIDPIKLNRLDVVAGSVSRFEIRDLKSCCASVARGSSNAEFMKFQNSLRQLSDVDDRIKLMFSLMSKELRVSTGLSVGAVKTTLSQAFGATNTGDIFGKMIGNFGDDVTQPVRTVGTSVSKLLRLESGRKVILPFEPIRIDESFIPGREMLIDSIVRPGSQFDITPLETFVTSFKNAIESMAYVFEGTLDVNVLNDKRIGLGAVDIYNRLMLAVREQLELALTSRQTSPIDKVTFPALVHARTDPTLKYLLYISILLRGFGRYINDKSSIEATQEHGFYDALNSAGLTADVVNNQFQVYAQDVVGSAMTLQDLIAKHFVDSLGNRPNISVSQSSAGHGLTSHTAFKSTSVQLGSIGTGMTSTKVSDSVSIPNSNNVEISLPFAADSIVKCPLFDAINQILNELHGLAQKSITATTPGENPNGYLSDTEQGVTKYNKIGIHFFVMMLLEASINIAAKFEFASVLGVRSGDDAPTVSDWSGPGGPPAGIPPQLIVNLDPDGTAVAYEVSDTTPGFRFRSLLFESAGRRDRFSTLSPQFTHFSESFEGEDSVMKDIIDTLLGVKQTMVKDLSELRQFIIRNKSTLQQLATGSDSDRMMSFDFSQAVLAQNLLIDHKEARQAAISNVMTNNDVTSTSEATPFIDDSTILPQVRNALLSMLRDSTFIASRADNAHIMSIGLPAGFTEALRTRLGTYVIGQDLAEFERRSGLQNDVIKVNVYMQDLLVEDIVFKPKSFIFEVGRFINGRGFSSVSPEMTFDRIVRDTIKTRSFASDGRAIDSFGAGDIIRDETYSFLNDDQSVELIRNHTISYLLGTYIRLLTGVDMSEEAFLINESINGMKLDEETRQQFTNILTQHVSQFVQHPVTLEELRNVNPDVRILLDRLLDDDDTEDVVGELGNVFTGESDSANIEISNDIVTFMNTFSKSSIIFGAAMHRMRMISPKMFERVFHVLVDPDDFEIDTIETNSTSAGKSLLGSSIVKQTMLNPFAPRGLPSITTSSAIGSAGSFIQHSPRLTLDAARRRELGQLTLRQYFVTIEQLPEFQQLETRPRPKTRNDEGTQLEPYMMNARATHNIPTELAPSDASPENLDFRILNTGNEIRRRRFGLDSLFGKGMF